MRQSGSLAQSWTMSSRLRARAMSLLDSMRPGPIHREAIEHELQQGGSE